MSKRIVFLILALIPVILLLAGWLYLRRSLPQARGTLAVAGLTAPVEIVRDADGVPHIRAATDLDAFFALGFVHAQDRLWQLEFQRRVAAGRLSEILGEPALQTDQFLRTLGPRRAAEAAWSQIQPESRRVLEAYARGVNAWIDMDPALPPEFLILGARPDRWTAIDSLAWAKMMAWDISGNWDEDLLRVRLAQAVGPERAAELMPAYPADGVTILAAEQLPAELGDELLGIDNHFQLDLGLRGRDIGSNSWVVAGKLTESGLPLLANDPHLGARIPSTWYLAELQGDRLHVAGATIPGLPGVLLGHNQDIAWGATSLGPDVQDLYLERVNPKDPNQYAVGGGRNAAEGGQDTVGGGRSVAEDGRSVAEGEPSDDGDAWADMTIAEEPIVVKGRDEPVRWAARATRHGPLVSDASAKAGAPVALRWTALDADDTTVDAFLGVNYARDWQAFTTALAGYVAPGMNFVYADRAGNIGYVAAGRVPIRASGESGAVPVAGWEDGHEWQGWIPAAEMPRALNPAEGYIVTANNRVVDDGYPYFITRDWAPPYRAERITELIRSKLAGTHKLTAGDMAAIQADQTSAQALELLPRLTAIEAADERQARALAALRGWDGRLGADSAAAAIYCAWFIQLGRAMFEDDLAGDLYETFAGRGHALFLADALARTDGPWCDNVLSAPRESCADTARVALDRALDDLEDRLGTDMSSWQWGRVHQTQYAHQPFSEVAWLRRFFHRQIPSGGDAYTVNVAPVRLDRLYDQHRGPSYRQILDLADWNAGRFMHTTGQSGHPLSTHYADLVERHQRVEYLSPGFGRAETDGERLTLQPAR